MIRGDAQPALLDSYEEERRPVAQALLRDTDRAFGLVVSQSPLAALFRVRTYNHERPNMALGGITPKQKLSAAKLVSTSGDR